MHPSGPVLRPNRPHRALEPRLARIVTLGVVLFAAAAAFADRSGPRAAALSTMDILFWGMQPGRVPPSAWPAIDAAVDRQRQRVGELIAQHGNPALWSVANAAEFDELGRDLERRGNEAIAMEVEFAEALRAALLDAGADAATAHRLSREWLFGRLRSGTGGHCAWARNVLFRLPHPNQMQLDPAERGAVEAALGAHLDRLVVAATERARAGHRAVRRYFSISDAALAEAVAPLIEADEARFCDATAALLGALQACHRSIVGAVVADRRPAIERTLRAAVFHVATPGYTDATLLPMRVVAPRMPGVDDEQRRRLAELVERTDRKVEVEINRGLDEIEAALRRGEHDAAREQLAALEQRAWMIARYALDDAAPIIGGDRVEQLLQLGGAPDDLPSRLVELVGVDAANAAISEMRGYWALKFAGDEPWRGVSHPSAGARRWTPRRCRGRCAIGLSGSRRAGRTSRTGSDAVVLHDRGWSARIAPEQARLRSRLAIWQSRDVTRTPQEDDAPWEQAMVEVDSLLRLIEAVERDLANAALASAPDDAARNVITGWLLERAVEVCAPNVPATQNEIGFDGAILALPVVPSELAALAQVESPTSPDARKLVPALTDGIRSRWALMTRLAVLEAEARRRVGPGWERTGKAPAGVDDVGAWLRDASITHRADPAEAERAWLDAWRPIAAAWRDSVEPSSWDRVRVAMAATMFPRLPTVFRSAPETIDHLAQACAGADDPRTEVLRGMAASLRSRRDARLVEAAEATLEIAQRPGDGVLLRGWRPALSDRQQAQRRFYDDVSEMEWRALRDAMIVAGPELSIQAPLARAILRGELDR